jgi:hypothetical protein
MLVIVQKETQFKSSHYHEDIKFQKHFVWQVSYSLGVFILLFSFSLSYQLKIHLWKCFGIGKYRTYAICCLYMGTTSRDVGECKG